MVRDMHAAAGIGGISKIGGGASGGGLSIAAIAAICAFSGLALVVGAAVFMCGLVRPKRRSRASFRKRGAGGPPPSPERGLWNSMDGSVRLGVSSFTFS